MVKEGESALHMDILGAKVRKVFKIMKALISLEAPIGEERDSHLSNFIEDHVVVSLPEFKACIPRRMVTNPVAG